MRVKICGRTYKVVEHGTGPDNYGLCDPNKATIHINPEVLETSAINRETVVLHEVIHAILYETGLHNVVKDRVEEAITHALAIHLHNAGYRLL